VTIGVLKLRNMLLMLYFSHLHYNDKA